MLEAAISRAVEYGGACRGRPWDNFMTRSSSAPSTQRRSANLSPAQIRTAIPQLEARMAELDALPIASLSSDRDPKVLAREHAIEATLARIFGRDTHEYHRLEAATHLGPASYRDLVEIRRASYQGAPPLQIHQLVRNGQQRAIALLTQEVALMREQLGDDGVAQPTGQSTPTETSICIRRSRSRRATYTVTAITPTPSKMRSRR
jgi:hypothetical protein